MQKIKKNKNSFLILGIFAFTFFFFALVRGASSSGNDVDLFANPSTVEFGHTSTLTWGGVRAEYCVTSWGGNTGPRGTYVTPPLTQTTTYSVQCYNPRSCVNVAGQLAMYGACQQKTTPEDCESILIPGSHPPESACLWDPYFGQASATVNVITPNGTGTITDITTNNPTEITDVSAVLSGSMNPGGIDGNYHTANVYFRYSPVESNPPIFCNDIYGTNMKATKEIPLWANFLYEIKLKVADLLPNTKYSFCVVGSAENQIAYGGVKTFTTKMSPDSISGNTDQMSISTESALVVDSTSAYLNGSYNTTSPAETYFMFKKGGASSGNPWGNGKIAVAQHAEGTSGQISYLIKQLSPGTTYQFRAVIESKKTNDVKNGNVLTFTTKTKGEIGPGGGQGGVGYIDPCASVDDVNCNGTGGGGGGTGEIIGGNLPDLTAGPVFPTNILVNVPFTLSATIRNQGNTSTSQTSGGNIKPGIINNYPPENTATPPVSFWKKLFQPKKALAALNTTTNTTGVGSTNNKGSFYSFFQVSTVNPIGVENTLSANTLSNFRPTLMAPLGAKASSILAQEYTFPRTGVYYARACADKKSPADIGLIKESYENNNCGPWTPINVSSSENWNTNTEDEINFNNDYTIINNNQNNVGDPNTLTLGQTATPPIDAIVRYHEGIETVLYRQIQANTELAESYGYRSGEDLNAFAWQLADFLARKFGYVGKNGKEIRVSLPDIAAYQLYMKDGVLTIYEYYDSKIVNIQKVTNTLRNIYKYEYYFRKIINKIF